MKVETQTIGLMRCCTRLVMPDLTDEHGTAVATWHCTDCGEKRQLVLGKIDATKATRVGRVFVTHDGYRLRRTIEAGKFVWTDGDLTFDDWRGYPVSPGGTLIPGESVGD